MIKTVITSDGVTKIVFDEFYKFYWVKNKGVTTVNVSAFCGRTAGEDNTVELEPNASVLVENYDDYSVYILGAGTVEIHAQNFIECPFKVAPTTGGGDISAKGDSVQFSGLQGGVPFPKIVVKSKNLATVPQNVVLFGNANNGFRIDESETGKSYIIPIKHNTQYTFSNYTFGDRLRIVLFKEYPTNTLSTNTKSIIYRETEIENYPVVTFNSDNYNCCVITVNRDAANFTPRIQLEIGGSATEYVRPIIGEELRISAFRKNLLSVEAMGKVSGNIHLVIKKDGYILLSGNSNFTSASSKLYIAQNINMTITKNMILSYFGNISGATPNATITRNGETIELTLNENGEKLQAGDILNSVYIQILEVGIEVSGAGRFHLELESDFIEYDPAYKYDYYITPDSNPYTVPFEIYQRDGLNYVYVTGNGEPTLTITGTKESITLEKIWNKLLDLETAIIVSNGEI